MSKLSKSTGVSSVDVATAAAAAGGGEGGAGGCSAVSRLRAGAAARGAVFGETLACAGGGSSGGRGACSSDGGAGGKNTGSTRGGAGSSTSSTTRGGSLVRCRGIGSAGTSIDNPPATTPTAIDQRRAIDPMESRCTSIDPIRREAPVNAGAVSTRGSPAPRSAMRGSSDHTPMGTAGSTTRRLRSCAAGCSARNEEGVGRGWLTSCSVLQSRWYRVGGAAALHRADAARASGLALAGSTRDVANATLEIPARRSSSSTPITRR